MHHLGAARCHELRYGSKDSYSQSLCRCLFRHLVQQSAELLSAWSDIHRLLHLSNILCPDRSMWFVDNHDYWCIDIRHCSTVAEQAMIHAGQSRCRDWFESE